MQNAGQQLLGRKRRKRRAAPPQEREQLALRAAGQQVERQLTSAADGDAPRQLEDHRPAHAVFRELQLPAPPFAAVGHLRLAADALERADEARLRAHLHERGIEPRAPVPDALQELIAEVDAAELCPGKAARTDDHTRGREGLLRRPDGEARCLAPQADHLAGGAQCDVRALLKRQPQHIGHAVGAVRCGIDPAGRLRDGQQPE